MNERQKNPSTDIMFWGYFQIWVPYSFNNDSYDITVNWVLQGIIKYLYPLKLDAASTRWKSVNQLIGDWSFFHIIDIMT